MCDIFFCGLINSFKVNLFLYNSTILWFSKLSLFLVVSEIKCKWGNNKRLWPRWNFSWNNTLLRIALKSETFYSEIRTTCSTNTLLVGNLVGNFRQLLKFPSDKYFWISNFLWKHILPMKFRKPSKKLLVRKATTHTETKIRTWILLTLCLPYSFTVKTFFYSSFLLT